MKGLTKILLLTILCVGVHATPTEGCTDPEAINYNESATYGENTCWYHFQKYMWTVELMSFHGVHPDNSLLNMISSLNTAYQIIGQGVASQEVSPLNWIGSISEIEPDKGYWIIQAIPDSLSYVAQRVNPNLEYCLTSGNNLISYPNKESHLIIEAFPENVLNSINQIATSGYAAIKDTLGQWHGSLGELSPWEGYWVNSTSTEELCFEFNNSYPLPRKTNYTHDEIPEELAFNQSTKQSFYFIKNNQNLKTGDYLVATRGNRVVGSTKITHEEYSTLPVMGNDGNWYSNKYMEHGDQVIIKIWNPSDKFTGTLSAENQLTFNDLNLEFINTYTVTEIEPTSFELVSIYPNPFNPTITIDFSLQKKSQVKIDIYDINGLFISTLENSYIENGTHRYVWDASSYASGIYLIKLTQNNTQIVRRISLIK